MADLKGLLLDADRAAKSIEAALDASHVASDLHLPVGRAARGGN